MSKVLVITTSLRARSNSDRLAEELIRGAADAGHDVERISLKGKEIRFCIGCLACQKTQKCVLKDDAVEIAEKVKNADTLVFATPIYYYEMSGQMKTLLDRLNPLYPSDYKFRKVYMLATATEDEEYVPEKAVSGLQGWVDCFEKAELAGSQARCSAAGSQTQEKQTERKRNRMKRTGLACHLRKGAAVCVALLLLLALCGCAKTETPESASAVVTDSTGTVTEDTALPESGEGTEVQAELPEESGSKQTTSTEDIPMTTELLLTIDGQEVSVAWEDNDSVAALKELAAKAPLTIQMSMYGGFEQVGPIGTNLPRNDVQTTTEAGDIVLYSGNQIVVFYGSNSWAYTRLGHITDQDAEGLAALLGSEAVTLSISALK